MYFCLYKASIYSRLLRGEWIVSGNCFCFETRGQYIGISKRFWIIVSWFLERASREEVDVCSALTEEGDASLPFFLYICIVV